jgi:flagellar M-ring protein FliF
MDFLNQAINQTSELFRSMTPGARVTAGLLLAVVVASFGYLFQYQSAAPDEFLFGGQFLTDGQINQMEGALGQSGLNDYERQGNRILVPRGRRADYLAAIADAGALPPNFHNYLENALSEGGPWESSEATRERLKIARQQMLSDIIRHMHWVQDAVVLYDEQQSRGLRRTKLVTASVSVTPIVGEMLDPRRSRELQKLIAHSVVGMRTEDVVITSMGGGFAGSGGSSFPEAFDNEYYQTRVAYELRKKDQILNALSDIPGVRVEVSAELDDTVQETIQNLKPDKSGTAVRALTVDESSESGMGGGGGPPGVTAQGPNRQGVLPQLVHNDTKKTTKSTEELNNLVGQEQRALQRTGFTPKSDWATITIPRTYVEDIWKQRNPEATDPPKPDDLTLVESQLITKVETIVQPLLTYANKGEDAYKQVKVAIVDSIAAPAIVPPSVANNALAWVGSYWSTLAMLGVAMFSLVVLKSVVKGSPTGAALLATSPNLTLHNEAPSPAEGGGEPGEAPRSRLKIKKGVSLKDDLAEMVKEDPDAAAAILKSWIGKAAA